MFVVNIADILIAIDNKYDYVKRQCKNYIIDSDKYDFCVSVTEADIEHEIAVNGSVTTTEHIESVCLYREIAQQLPYYNAFIMHCAAIECNGSAICFAAKSGTGKTTHINLWRKAFGEQANIINGDKPIFRYNGNGFNVYGTPWSGKENYNRNTFAPFKTICFLERGLINKIDKIQVHTAINKLLHQVYLPKSDNNAYDLTLNLLDKLMSTADIWELHCTISEEAAVIARNKIFSEK